MSWTLTHNPVFIQALSPAGRMRQYAKTQHIELTTLDGYKMIDGTGLPLATMDEAALNALWNAQSTKIRPYRQHLRAVKPRNPRYQVRW